ncbi:MAG: hypothetical protein HC902_04625, partial [Calothrix sp. SM1_5_4]|nr:hypothetical protein [Calothrix sp. SM1_5_4]
MKTSVWILFVTLSTGALVLLFQNCGQAMQGRIVLESAATGAPPVDSGSSLTQLPPA